MDLGLTKEEAFNILKGSDLSEESANIIAEAIARNNKTIEGNLDRYIHNIFVSRMKPRGFI